MPLVKKRSKRSPKDKLLGQIRARRASAALLRLSGHVQNAMFNEGVLDRLLAKAEARGWGDDATVADEEGEREGRRLFQKQERG